MREYNWNKLVETRQSSRIISINQCQRRQFLSYTTFEFVRGKSAYPIQQRLAVCPANPAGAFWMRLWPRFPLQRMREHRACPWGRANGTNGTLRLRLCLLQERNSPHDAERVEIILKKYRIVSELSDIIYVQNEVSFPVFSHHFVSDYFFPALLIRFIGKYRKSFTSQICKTR